MTPPKDKLLEQLASYFTGLQLGGHARTLAEPLFAMRSALGIEGYATREEAIAALRSRSQTTEPGEG
jgi:hypothetical protein